MYGNNYVTPDSGGYDAPFDGGGYDENYVMHSNSELRHPDAHNGMSKLPSSMPDGYDPISGTHSTNSTYTSSAVATTSSNTAANANVGKSSSKTASQSVESIKVLVRVRPMSESEYLQGEGDLGVVDIQSNTNLALSNADGRRQFQCTFDAVLGPESTQSDVYATVQGCTKSVIDGFNSTIFAYGQTGSGKTFSMYGPPSDDGSRTATTDPAMVGLIPRAIQEIFELSHNKDVIHFSVFCSFVQIYNENLFDMLRDASMGCPLTIREDQKEIYVQGLSEYNVKTVADTMQLLRIAEDNRAIRETHMNQFSSRSHSIFQIYVEQKRVAVDGGEVSLKAKFNLVDLAGSEKWNTQREMGEKHITEMNNINLSLHTLGKCISSLAQKSLGKDVHIPYRESKLTRLLQDSLGGNAKTFLIATLSPARHSVEESISTLKFADRAKQVMVQAVINETRPVDHAMVQRLQKELEHLRSLLRQLTAERGAAGMNMQPGMGGGGTALWDAANAAVWGVGGGGGGGGGVGGMDANYEMENQGGNNGNQIVESLKRSLLQERERGDNISRELTAWKSKCSNMENQLQMQHQQLQQQQQSFDMQQSQKQQGSQEALRILEGYKVQSSRMWEHVSNLQKTFKRFFKFEIEEDDMKQQVEQLFRAMEALHSESVQSAAAAVPYQNGNGIGGGAFANEPMGGRGGGGIGGGVGVGGGGIRLSSDQVRKGAYSDLKNGASNGFMNPSSSEPRMASMQMPLQVQVQAPPRGRYDSAPSSASPTGGGFGGGVGGGFNQQPSNGGNVRSSGRDLPPTLPPLGSGVAGGGGGGGGGLGGGRYGRQHSSPRVNNAIASYSPQNPNRSQQPQNMSFKGHNNNMSSVAGHVGAGIAVPVGNISFRVRGSVDSKSSSKDGVWIQPPTDEDEEAILQRELKKAKKKLKKQQQLQEWMREKEERAYSALKQEEDERKALEESEMLKEQKRREYAKKQKQKLNGYRDRVKQEATQIQELLDMGIDPTELM